MRTHRLWKDNRIDKEYQVDCDDLQQQFDAWLGLKGIDYVNYCNTERLIRFFLTDNEGMSSVFDESDFVAFVEDLGPVIRAFEKANAKATNP